MGNSAIGRGTAVEENKVKASAGDTPDFLDAKVGTSMKVASDLLEIGVTGESDGDMLFFDGTDWVKARGVEKIKSIVVSKNLADASTTTAYVGVGFRPTAIWATCKLNNTIIFSVGFVDENNHGGGNGLRGALWTGGLGNTGNALLVSPFSSAGNGQGLSGITYQADGFTGNWGKTGAGVGSASINFICFR